MLWRALGLLMLLAAPAALAGAATSPASPGADALLFPAVAPSLAGAPLAPLPHWQVGVSPPVPPPALAPRALPTVSATVPLLGSDLSYAIVARSGDVERVVAGDPLLPRAISLRSSSGTGLGALPLFSPQGDVLVSATGFSGLALFEPSFSFSVKRLAREPMPLDLYVVRALPGGGAAYAGFRTAAAPEVLAVSVRGDLGDRFSLTLTTVGASAPLALEAGRTGTEALAIEVALAAPPALAELDLEPPGDGGRRATWRLAQPTGIAIHLADESGALLAQWARAPATGSLLLDAAGERLVFDYAAEAPGGALLVSSGDASRAIALHASEVPTRWRIEFEETPGIRLAYAADASIPRLALAIGNATRGLHADARDLPLNFHAAGDARGALHLASATPFGALTLFEGALARCLATSGAFVSVAGAGDSACSSFSLPGVLALDVAREGDAYVLGSRLAKESAIVARFQSDASRADVRLTPLPRAFNATVALAERDLRIAIETDGSPAIEGAITHGARAEAPAPPPAGLATRFGREGGTAFRLPALPARLAIAITGGLDEAPATDARDVGGLAVAVGGLGAAFEASLSLAGSADAPLARLQWSAPGAHGPLRAVLDRPHEGWLAVEATALPSEGNLDLEPEALAFRLADPPGLEVRAFEGTGARDVRVPAEPLTRGILVSRTEEGRAVLLRMPRAPGEGNLTWQDDAASLRYVDLPESGPFTFEVRDETERATGAIHLPREADVTVERRDGYARVAYAGETGPSPVELRVSGPGGDGFLSLADAPRSFDLVVSDATPHLVYDAAAPGAALAMGGTGDVFGLGRGGALSLPNAPAYLAIASDAEGAYRLTTTAPVDATLDLGEKRWGDGLLGFTTERTRLELAAVEDLRVLPGVLSTEVAGTAGKIEIEHTPKDPASAVYFVAAGNPAANAGWNRVDLPLVAGETTTLWHTLNPLLVFHASPILAFGAVGALLGGLARFLVGRLARGKASSPVEA